MKPQPRIGRSRHYDLARPTKLDWMDMDRVVEWLSDQRTIEAYRSKPRTQNKYYHVPLPQTFQINHVHRVKLHLIPTIYARINDIPNHNHALYNKNNYLMTEILITHNKNCHSAQCNRNNNNKMVENNNYNKFTKDHAIYKFVTCD